MAENREVRLDNKSVIERKGENCHTVFGKNVRLINARIVMAQDSELIVGDNVILRGYIAISSGCKIIIGDRTKCNYPVHIVVSEKTTLHIGCDCLFSDMSLYTSDTHSIFCRKTGAKINVASNIFIGDRVWLGRKTWVMKGSHIESDVVVAAGAMVTGYISSNTICAGVPARVIKQDILWCDERVDTLPERMESQLL
ncbi:hypothetical protein MMG00_00830 [Ignatzschineria rhizosphaerae]|uniref:Acyltransferase n=1 Tax=Ignatzschineria rhizosphaerae TaxID=2923279 RepID=A0ABY3X0N8_9GAMM|nr:hypothetical protein [Ignatzschineria rhizosphaerae]UNM96447.1 hypothetical protein MMG00_00830 [Ignatzschineria rhizosphaerae]